MCVGQLTLSLVDLSLLHGVFWVANSVQFESGYSWGM